jgi:hypothetical protein
MLPVLFLTAVSLGLAAGALRSAFAILLAPLALVTLYALAAAFAPGPVSLIDLLLAIAGLNAGLIATVLALMLVAARRHTA